MVSLAIEAPSPWSPWGFFGSEADEIERGEEVRDKGRSERALLREKESVREKLARGVGCP
jgi:hypothetical protein